MIYLILGPFGIFFLFRVLLPSIWCFDFLVINDITHKYYDIVFLHLIYLLLEGFLVIALSIYIVNLSIKYRKYRNAQEYIIKKNAQGNKYAIIAILGIIFFLIFNFDSLPIFLDGGSDALVALVESEKTKTWIMYGLLSIFTGMLLISILYIKSKKMKIFYFIILLFTSLINGKKSALVGFLSKFLFSYFLFNPTKPYLPVIKIGIGFLLSIIFIVLQFTRTAGLDFDIFQVFNIIFGLIYSSSTVYLSQIINGGGIEYIELYSELLGNGGSIIYILNPFMKFLFGIGIYKAPGPFLGEMLYGYTFPNGVNPTLFFEPMFVFGSYLAIIFSFLNLIIVFILAKYFIKKTIINFDTSILLTITYFGLFYSMLSFTSDTLNAVRNLPFILFPLFLFYFIKFLVIISNKKRGGL